MMGALVGALDIVGEAVVGCDVGLGEMVGSLVPLGMTEISAQLKNCSGQVVLLVPSAG